MSSLKLARICCGIFVLMAFIELISYATGSLNYHASSNLESGFFLLIGGVAFWISFISIIIHAVRNG